MKIKSINIGAFRGIPQMEIDLQGNNFLLLGENGTGKSSIVDAFEFFFTGKINHLPGKPSVSLKNYACHVNFEPDDLKISMEVNPGGSTIERTLDSFSSCPPSMENEFKIAESGRFILRRSEILNFIESAPGERYKFIGKILNIDKLEKTEKEILNSYKYLKNQVETLEEHIQEINDYFQDVVGYDKVKDNLLNKINELLANEKLDRIKSIEEIEEYVKNLKEKIELVDKEKINALENISKKIETVPSINDEISSKLVEASSIKKEILELHNISDLSVMEILKNSKKILTTDTEECPLCEQELDGKNLIRRINERLKDLEALGKRNEQLKNVIKGIIDKFTSLIGDLDLISSNMVLFPEINALRQEIEQNINNLNEIFKQLNFQTFMKDEIDDFEDLKNQLESVLKKIKVEAEKLDISLKSSEKDERMENIHNTLIYIADKLKEFGKINDKLTIAQKRFEISEKISTTFSDIKKCKIQEVYDTVEGDIQRFYDMLHPHELYENIKLGIDPRRRASTNLKMTIFGKEDEDPRALSSEGHLDSLGLCIFLALFRKFNEDFPLLVLDDVVTTVDSRHRENVCKLLFNEFSDNQLIITTHDGIWFEQLRAAQRVYNLGNQFRNCSIIKWDIDNGPDIRPYKVRWDRIQESIQEGDKYCAGNEGRRYLEWLLEDICNRTIANIPSKHSRKYEVGDLLQPARSRLKKLIKYDDYKDKIENAFTDLEKNIMMGNLLSHDNLLAGNVSIDEVERFCNSIHEIDALLRCDCGAPLGYFRDLKIFRCKNKNCSNPREIKLN